MSTITLTPAEIELIELKRKQDEIAKQEKELKHKASLEKDIERQKQYMQQEKNTVDVLIQHTKAFFQNGFSADGRFELVYKKYSIAFCVKDYTNQEDPRSNNWERYDYWKESIDLQEAYIRLKDNDNMQITIVKTVRGYEMKLDRGFDWDDSRRTYKNVKTVIQKLNNKIAKDDKVTLMLNRKQIALDSCVATWSAKYPGCEVVYEKLYTGGYYGTGSNRRWSDIMNSHVGVCITMPNGIITKVRYSESTDSWTIHNVKYPIPPTPKGDADDVLSQLSKMTFDIQ
jgi:hypothetical protein